MKKKVFVGRENELEQFRQTMRKLQEEHTKKEPYANAILVYGVGGMGKTFLCRKFIDIIETEFPSILPIYIDWDMCKNRGSTFTPEELLDILHRELNAHFPKEMKPYLGAKKDIKKEQEKIERLLEQKRQSLDTVSQTAAEVTSEITGNKHLGTLVKTGLGLMGKAFSALDEKFLKEKPVILLLDTCELIVHVEEWLTDRYLIPLLEENPNFVLVFSGRYNPYTQRTIEIDGHTLDIRGMADRMSYPPQRIDMQLFSRKDIEKYLKEMGFQEVHDQIIDFVQSFSRGVPYAVDLLTNALERIGNEKVLKDFAGVEFEKQLREAKSNEAVIKCVSRRFIKYCLDEEGNQIDRDRIFSIAVLGDTDSEVLKTVWQTDKPGDILETLQARYALFIGHGKLHDVVKDFLVDYILENRNFFSEIAGPSAQRALPLYEKKYRQECEQEPIWAERFREGLWKQALERLMNAMVWVSPNDAVDFFLKRSIELFLFSPDLVSKLKQLLDKFLKLEKEIRGRNRRKVNALMQAVDNFNWYSWFHKKEAFNHVLSFCKEALEEWELEPVHKAIILIIKARAEYHQENYEPALKTLLERVDESHLEKSLKNKLAEALDDVGEKFCLDEKDNFFYSEKALKAFERVVHLHRRKYSYLYHLGVMLKQGGNPQKALPYYLESIELEPGNKYVLLSIGNVYSDLKDYDTAIEMYQKAIDIDPKYATPFNGLGNVYSDKKDYDKAIEMYQKAIDIDPKFAYPFNGLGNVYYQLKDYDKAIEMYQKAIDIDPKYASPFNGLGNVYYQLKDYDKAIEMYQKAIDIDPKYAYPFNGLGNVYDDLKDYDKAIEMYQKAIDIDPKYASPFNGLGYLHLTLGRYTDAIPHLLKSVEIEPDISTYINLGIAYYCMEEPEKAIDFFEKGLSCPDIPVDAHHQLNRVTALLGTNKKDNALALLEKISEKKPPKSSLTDFFTDCELLASSPRPPQGIREFISTAKEMLSV